MKSPVASSALGLPTLMLSNLYGKKFARTLRRNARPHHQQAFAGIKNGLGRMPRSAKSPVHGDLWWQLATWTAPSPQLFFVTDRQSGTRFLIDTGAEVSVIPPSRKDKQHKHPLDYVTWHRHFNASWMTYSMA